MDTFLSNNDLVINKYDKKPKRIAIIGSGITGLSAAWLLSKKNDVCIYEKNSQLGGHSNTVKVNYTNSDNLYANINVDTGFIVFNEKNYPNLNNFFKKLNVETINSDMSFSFSLNKGKYEYSGSGLNGIFGQRKNLFKRYQWELVLDIIKFSKKAKDHIKNNNNKNTDNLINWLKNNNFSDIFIYNYIVPMASSIWSCTSKNVFDFPINSFLHFFYHHGLLNFKNRPQWKTVKNGSIQYIKAIIKDSNFNYKLNSNIKSIFHKNNKIYIENDHNIFEYDEIIIACQPFEILKFYKNIDKKSEKILRLFKFSQNKVVLHRSEQFMPKNKKLWSSWNYFSNNSVDKKTTLQMTYWMNKLQKIDIKFPLFVTMNINNIEQIKENKIFKIIEYEHPIIDQKSSEAQIKLNNIQGINNVWYSGAWTGYGFHEDGIKSGIETAQKLGAQCPWNLIFKKKFEYGNTF